jgi:hypothetical protein
LNPRHIIIDGNNKPFVIDIGLSKTIAEDATITQTGLILGSPPFMSPEQLDSKKKLDCRSDIFSLGAVLYTMLTGSLPYEELNPANVFIKQLREPFPLVKEKNPGISEKACRLVEIMTARKRFYRQKDWDTAINDIQLVIKDKTPETRRPPRSSSNRQTAREHPRIKPENRPKTAKLYESGSSSRHSEARNNSSLYLIILLSVFLTVLLGVGLFLAKSRREEKDRLKREKEEAARLSAIHNKRRALTLKRLETKKRVKALKKWEKAVAYANSCIRQNGMYNKAIKKIEDVKIELAGTLYALKADKAIKILRKAREKNIHRTMKKLEDNARKFIEQKQFSRAAEIFANYTGPLADETLNHRKNREAFYNDRLSAFSLNKKKIQQRKIEKTREMLRKTAEFIYKGEIEKAIESIAGASGDEKIKNLEKSLKVLIERKKYIIDSFRKDLGQNIDIFLDDKLKKLKIKEVTDEKVYASEEIENGARMTYPLPLKDMTLEEKAGRLSAYDKTAAELYYGIISVKRRNFKMAETSFSKTGFISSPLIKILREEKNKRYQFDYPY